MLNAMTNKGRGGVRDWIIQRVSAVLIAAYVIFLTFYMLLHPGLDYLIWQNLFSMTAMRVFSLLVLFSLVLHTWVGMWTISTDYLKSILVRFVFQVAVFLALSTCLIWGIQIFWGV
jgi:succinate dehydrogenase / fumarate reductase membrane anchor subunit